MVRHFSYPLLFLLLLACSPDKDAIGQCIPHQIFHLSGTQSVGCVAVTVTSDGGTKSNPLGFCGFEPYHIGYLTTGSFTFTFSNPVPEVWINFEALHNSVNNTPPDVEELSIEVNGTFFPVTNVGVNTGCGPLPIISPTGTLAGDPAAGGIGSSSQDLVIAGNINSIRIENIYLSGQPNGTGVSVFVCCPVCLTEAGEIPATSLNLCINDVATVPPAEDTFLDADDLLEYILFTDPADTLGSIIATNSTPEFAFDPTIMQLGVTYYIAALAGNDLGGHVDHADPCLDISNAVEVVWHPLPSVVFSIADTDVCANGCHDIGVGFTGTPPFTLIGEVTAGNFFLSNFSQTYSSNVDVLTICLPPSTPIGNIVVEATFLADANCACE